MLVDTIVIILIVLAFFKGFNKGFIVAVFSFVGYVIGMAAALKLSAFAARLISEHTNIAERWLPVLAFLMVFIIVVLLIKIRSQTNRNRSPATHAWLAK